MRAVGQRTTVIVDSGFRRGSDVVKALAIGAKLVMLVNFWESFIL